MLVLLMMQIIRITMIIITNISNSTHNMGTRKNANDNNNNNNNNNNININVNVRNPKSIIIPKIVITMICVNVRTSTILMIIVIAIILSNLIPTLIIKQ